MAIPIHEIMAESSAGMANARRFRRPPNTPPPGWSPRPAGSGRGFVGDLSQMGRDLTSGMAGRRRSGRGFVGDASQMGRDLSGIMNPVLRRPAVGNTAGRRRWTPGSTGRMIYSTPEENEFSGGVLPDPGQYQNPYFGMKQRNPNDIGGQTWDVDYTSEDLTEQERPRWDILNRLKQLYPFNRGGIASLPYAR